MRASLFAAVGILMPIGLPTTAHAAVTCSYDGGSKTVSITLDADGDTATLSTNAEESLLVNGAACGPATLTNTDSVVVRTDDPLEVEDQTFVLDRTRHRFANQTFDVDLGAGDDNLVIHAGETGSRGWNFIWLGSAGINLNVSREEAVHVTHAGIEGIEIFGGGSFDYIRGTGGRGTGGPTTIPLTLWGRSGADWLYGGMGDDVIHGGRGRDVLFGRGGNDDLNGGADPPAPRTWASPPSTYFGDWLVGGPGDDILRGSPGRNRHIGGGGDDRFVGGPAGSVTLIAGGPGADVISGGDGRDVADYRNRKLPVRVTKDGDPDDGFDGEGDNVGGRIDEIWGTAHDDVLAGNDRRDVLRGFEGDDRLIGAGAGDALFGGPGNDTISGGTGPDKIWGGSGNDVIRTGPGHDWAHGGSGHDRLVGELGPVHLIGGSGRDTISAGDGADLIDALDGERDIVDAGSEPPLGDTGDRCRVDPDLDVTIGCEQSGSENFEA